MSKYKTFQITYADPNTHSDELVISYRLRQTPIAYKWVERVLTAQQLGYQIDDRERFYGFGSIQEQTQKALHQINQLISILNKWIKIDYRLHTITDQDTLNRLHHVFEVEHGLLNEKNSDSDYANCLCNLNLLVHRCESIARGAHPRHVVTYFGLPKTEILANDDYKHFESTVNFGTVYINYVEIGKTLYDLMLDNDTYIDPTAFQPFRHYSADFVVKFWNDDNSNIKDQLQKYYADNKTFFESFGYTWSMLSQSIGGIPVADIDYAGNILNNLVTRQFVKTVQFY